MPLPTSWSACWRPPPRRLAAPLVPLAAGRADRPACKNRAGRRHGREVAGRSAGRRPWRRRDRGRAREVAAAADGLAGRAGRRGLPRDARRVPRSCPPAGRDADGGPQPGGGAPERDAGRSRQRPRQLLDVRARLLLRGRARRAGIGRAPDPARDRDDRLPGPAAARARAADRSIRSSCCGPEPATGSPVAAPRPARAAAARPGSPARSRAAAPRRPGCPGRARGRAARPRRTEARPSSASRRCRSKLASPKLGSIASRRREQQRVGAVAGPVRRDDDRRRVGRVEQRRHSSALEQRQVGRHDQQRVGAPDLWACA